MKLSILFAAMTIAFSSSSVFAQTETPLQHIPDLQTPIQRRVDPIWMHIPQQHTPIINEGKFVATSEAFQDQKFQQKSKSLKSLELAHASITFPIYWARWEKNKELLIANIIFTLKFNGKAWTESAGALHIAGHVAINPKNFGEIQLIDLQSFRDNNLKNRWDKTPEAHIQADREFILAISKPALAYYFSQPEIVLSWKNKITDAFGSYCFKYQTLSSSEACKSQVFKPQESPVQ